MPLRVLHVVESFASGCFTALQTLCNVVQDDVQHDIAYGVRRETPGEFAAQFPPGTGFLPLRIQRDVRLAADALAYREIVACIRKIRPDVVHCHSSKAGFLGRLAAWRCGVPSVYTPHGYSFLRTDIGTGKRCLFRMGEWLATRFGDCIAACGEQEYSEASRLGRTIRICNSVDLETLASVTPMDVPCDRPLVGICGRLDVPRHPALFGAVADQFAETAAWVWIGGSRGQNASLPPHVMVTGWLPRAQALSWTARLSVYLQTSLWEGLSYGILEAMALGKPVVATRIKANEAIVEHGVTGFLASDAEELCGYVRLLLEDEKLRVRMGQAAREKVAEQYDAKRAYRAYADLYAALARARRG